MPFSRMASKRKTGKAAFLKPGATLSVAAARATYRTQHSSLTLNKSTTLWRQKAPKRRQDNRIIDCDLGLEIDVFVMQDPFIEASIGATGLHDPIVKLVVMLKITGYMAS